MATDEFAQFGGAASVDSSDEFSAFGGHSNPVDNGLTPEQNALADALPPEEQASIPGIPERKLSLEQQQRYIANLNKPGAVIPSASEVAGRAPDVYGKSAIGRDIGALLDATVSNKGMSPDYVEEEQGSVLPSMRKFPILGPLAANTGHAVMKLAAEGKMGAENALDTATADAAKNGKVLSNLHAVGALATGVPLAGYNVINPLANVVERGVKDVGSDAMRLVGAKDAAANWEAQKDLDRIDYNQKADAVLNAIRGWSPNPSLTAGVENIAPFVVPTGIGLESGPLAARIATSLGNDVERAVSSPLGNSIGNVASHTIGHGLPVSGLIRRAVVQPALDFVGPKLGTAVKSVASPVLSTAGPLATAAAFGLGNANPGEDVESIRNSLGVGGLAAIPSLVRSGFVRQALERADANADLARTGSTLTQGTNLLSPETAQQVNRLQGLFANRTAGENPVRFVVKGGNDYARAAVTAALDGDTQFSGATPSDVQSTQGFFRPATGEIVINATPKNGTVDPIAVAHETGHSIGPVLAGLSRPQFDQLTKSVLGAALDGNGNPTPAFQTFIDHYKRRPVDWASLNPEAKQSYLDELGAHTAAVSGALNDPGALTLKPELSDVVFNGLGDFARKVGLKQSPDLLQGFGGDTKGLIAPADTSLINSTRDALRTIGRASQASRAPEPLRNVAPAQRDTPVPVPSIRLTPTPENSAQPVAAGQAKSNAYQDAYAIATSPAKGFGLALTPEQATARLDAAEQAGAQTAQDYLFHAQKGRLPDARTSAPTVDRGTTPATEATPQAEVPQPADDTAAQEGVVTPRANSLAPNTNGETTPGQTPPESAQELGLLRGQSQDDTGHAQAGANNPGATDNLQNDSTNQSVRDSNSSRSEDGKTSDTLTPEPISAAIPFTADDAAKIREDVAKSFKPAPYNPRGTPQERAQKIADDKVQQLAAAQRNAVLQAHKEAIPEGDTRVQLRENPETGRNSFTGRSFVSGDPLHDDVMAHLSPEDRQRVADVQNAIRDNKVLDLDYFSAKRTRLDVTNAQRQEAQAASTASERAQGTGEGELQKGKAILPQNFTVTPDNKVIVSGISLDKLAGNFNKAIDVFKQTGRDVPWDDINDPQAMADIQAYFRNQANGRSGDGTKVLQGTDAIPVHAPENYEPTVLPKSTADFINLALNQQDAKSQQGGKNNKTSTAAARNIQEFAKLNGIDPTEAGEVNNLRQSVDDAGNFTVGPDTGTKAVLENPLHENIRVDNIRRLAPFMGDTADASNLRAQGFRGNRADFIAEGKPNAKFTSAGFLPSMSDAVSYNNGDGPTRPNPSGEDAQNPLLNAKTYLRNLANGAGRPSGSSHWPLPQEYANQRAKLDQWARENGLLITPGITKANARQGGEHISYYDPATNRWIKTTYPDSYGAIPALDYDMAGNPIGLTIRQATLLEYLDRIDAHNAMFGDNVRLIGVTKAFKGLSTVISQPHLEGPIPTAQQITSSLAEQGFELVQGIPEQRGLTPLYYRASDGTIVSDATPDNFRYAGGTAIPLDVGISEANPAVRAFIEQQRSQVEPKSASFLPAREAGATPETLGMMPRIVRSGDTIPGTDARAAEDLPVQRIGNATVTRAGVQFLPAYHGTPHTVDRFDSSKIGTGEGNQVYGHGLYFADQKAVAQEYQKELAAPEFTSKETGEVIGETHPDYPALFSRYQRMNSNGYGADFAEGHDVRHGNLYGVDLDIHPEQLLDWDKSLNAQSKQVQAALGPLVQKYILSNDDFINAPLKKAVASGDVPISKLYRLLGGEISLANNSRLAPPQAASNALNEAGIHGIRYLDQGSRATGDGSNNYVMFDDSKIRITHRNDAPVQ